VFHISFFLIYWRHGADDPEQVKPNRRFESTVGIALKSYSHFLVGLTKSLAPQEKNHI